ncbi:hypothetical protein ATCC90586_006607 [Pythium insidiosum]|nr:hypothetical protein ATCC90586_006607 [Pythium insidiosum]
MTLTLSASTVRVNAFVSATWTVRRERSRLARNALEMEDYFRTSDRDTNEVVDIVHSNIHSCEFGSNCDPFRSGDRARDNTRNQVAFLNGSDSFTFTSQQELLFPQPGTFSVLAHIILPGRDSARERFDFAVYRRLVVTTETQAPSMVASPLDGPTETLTPRSPRVSCGVIAMIVLACLLLLAILTCVAIVWGSRWRRQRLAFATSPMSNSPRHLRFVEFTMYDAEKQQYPSDESASAVVIDAARDVHREKMQVPRPAPYLQFSSWMSPRSKGTSSDCTRLPQFVSESDTADVLSRSNSLQLYNREIGNATRFMDGTTSFEVPAHPRHRERPSQIFGTTNTVDFVYSDGSMIEIMDIDGTILMPPPTLGDQNEDLFGSFVAIIDPPLSEEDLQDEAKSTKLHIRDLETPQAMVTSPRAA